MRVIVHISVLSVLSQSLINYCNSSIESFDTYSSSIQSDIIDETLKPNYLTFLETVKDVNYLILIKCSIVE